MEINVTLYNYLKNDRFSNAIVTLPDSAKVDNLLDHLQIKQHEIGSIFINRQSCTFETVLNPDDKVELLPLIGGG